MLPTDISILILEFDARACTMKSIRRIKRYDADQDDAEMDRQISSDILNLCYHIEIRMESATDTLMMDFDIQRCNNEIYNWNIGKFTRS